VVRAFPKAVRRLAVIPGKPPDSRQRESEVALSLGDVTSTANAQPMHPSQVEMAQEVP
jgi:hypothetical protein